MMRLTHDNKVFSPDDVRWIGLIEIGGVDGRTGNPFLVQYHRFLPRKGKGVRREHGTLAQISPWLIKYIGEGEIDVVFAAAGSVLGSSGCGGSAGPGIGAFGDNTAVARRLRTGIVRLNSSAWDGGRPLRRLQAVGQRSGIWQVRSAGVHRHQRHRRLRRLTVTTHLAS